MPDTITVVQLGRLIGRPDTPVLVDVRIDNDYAADPRMIPASFRRDYRTISTCAGEYAGRSVVVICPRGQKLSQGVATCVTQVRELKASKEASRRGSPPKACWSSPTTCQSGMIGDAPCGLRARGQKLIASPVPG
jgi:rhodanese-related sulfurtransferase